MHKLTFKDFINEGAPSPSNMDDSFTVGKIKFDNARGLGSTPMGQNVIYRGAVAWLKVSTFRSLALQEDRTSDATKIADLLKSGQAIAAPFLIIDIVGEPSSPTTVKVTSHEGRARAAAIQMLEGDVYIPVQLHPIGLRARDLTPEFFKWIETHGIKAEQSYTSVQLNARAYYYAGGEINV